MTDAPPWHTLLETDVARHLQTNLVTGLTESQARRRLDDYGPNLLPEPASPSAFALLLRQGNNLIVWVLIGAAVISGILHEWVDTAAILAIVVLHAVLGFIQEYRAERSLAALRKLSQAFARVLRDNTRREIPARDVVPGDLIVVESGDHIPADARLIYAANLRTQEAALTGESTPVEKTDQLLPHPALPLADQTNRLFLGTHIVSGKGRAVVVATGLQTELGHIATLLQRETVQETPLQQHLAHLGRMLLLLSLGIVMVVFLLGLLRGEPLVVMLLTAMSLAVAAIPEGLPAIVTMTLALGVTRMVKRHALIRYLPAVETLGATTVICTDKTGTLTKNEMTVSRLLVGDRIFSVTGEGYTPVGDIRNEAHQEYLPPGVRELLTAAALCNDAALREERGAWTILGDPTEGALLAAAAKAGLDKPTLLAAFPLLGEVPFDPERKRMTTVHLTTIGAVAYSKGAPDMLLKVCTHTLTCEGQTILLTELVRQQILAGNDRFAGEALRVLGVACRSLQQVPQAFLAHEIEQHLTFLGLVAMKDPLRPEAKTAARVCREAGIRTVMITGDHKTTAIAIARELGIANDETQALSGMELDGLSDEALANDVQHTAVYARVSAAHKLRIVKAWQAHGAIVAMTGDGVNDAPAVKAADIGVAMGRAGTDVTKEAAAMVVTDDNFASIAAAVEEGRGIYDNIQKAVSYLLSCNLSEMLLMLFATVSFLPLPLLPTQILWINLVTDGLPALALATGAVDPTLMQRPPRKPHAAMLPLEQLLRLSGQGLFIAVVTLSTFLFFLYRADQDLHEARTAAFTVLVLSQLTHALNYRGAYADSFFASFGANPLLLWALLGSALLQFILALFPWTRAVFGLAPLAFKEWLLLGVLGISPLLLSLFSTKNRHKLRLDHAAENIGTRDHPD